MTDRDVSLAFLETYFAAYPNKQAWTGITWNTPKPSGEEGKWHSEWHQLGELYQMIEFTYNEKANIYFRPAPLREKPPRGKRGGQADVDGLIGVSADVDVEGPSHRNNDRLPKNLDDVKTIMKSFAHHPSLSLPTGGGYQFH
jgi:hypothetical protein